MAQIAGGRIQVIHVWKYALALLLMLAFFIVGFIMGYGLGIQIGSI